MSKHTGKKFKRLNDDGNGTGNNTSPFFNKPNNEELIRCARSGELIDRKAFSNTPISDAEILSRAPFHVTDKSKLEQIAADFFYTYHSAIGTSADHHFLRLEREKIATQFEADSAAVDMHDEEQLEENYDPTKVRPLTMGEKGGAASLGFVIAVGIGTGIFALGNIAAGTGAWPAMEDGGFGGAWAQFSMVAATAMVPIAYHCSQHSIRSHKTRERIKANLKKGLLGSTGVWLLGVGTMNALAGGGAYDTGDGFSILSALEPLARGSLPFAQVAIEMSAASLLFMSISDTLRGAKNVTTEKAQGKAVAIENYERASQRNEASDNRSAAMVGLRDAFRAGCSDFVNAFIGRHEGLVKRENSRIAAVAGGFTVIEGNGG